MMRLRHLTLGLACAGFLAALAPPAMAQDDNITAAQLTLPKQPLSIVSDGGKTHQFQVEMAMTPQQQEVGLMFRHGVASDSGMLFVFPAAQEGQFWMKNTLVPLDMVFIGADGKVIHIAEDTVPQSLAQISSGGAVKATLELQAGITEKLDIRVGDKVTGAGL